MRFQAPRGTEDVLPSESFKWQRLEAAFHDLARRYGYKEIRTPTFEDVQLFVRSDGDTSDVVSKEMYDFFDKGERHIALKPEGTAPALRALIEHGLIQPGVINKVFYNTPVFRYERPQKGRLREHHQVGIELIGSAGAAADAEVIEVAVRFYQSLGLKDFNVLLNSIGREECREKYREAILEFAKPYLLGLESEERERLSRNPLRMVDLKDPEAVEIMKDAPSILDYLEPESQARFETIQSLLTEAEIAYEVAPQIVRGLDYYTETVFELQVSNIGSQNAIGGGGRYDNLVSALGGSASPSVGFGIGVERALLALEADEVALAEQPMDAFVAIAGEDQAEAGRKLVRRLRDLGLTAIWDLELRSLKSQLKQADKANCRFAILLGEDEAAAGKLTLRNLATSDQVLVTAAEAIEALRQ